MNLTKTEKENMVINIRNAVCGTSSLKKAIIFGSFLSSDNPNDLDICLVDDRDLPYLSLAMEYRWKLDSISKQIPLDVIPVKQLPDTFFFNEVRKGLVIYEK